LAGIRFEHVTKRYGKYKELAVNDFNLEVTDGEFLVLVGPSGCGKSTVLRMLAGLEDITEGSIYIDDVKVNDYPPKDRDISMVFQNYALYPNLTVYENIAFGLRLRKLPKHEIDLSVRRAARVLEIEPFLNRKPRELSGGQRQRVALGRAIVRSPRAFLMDEPLSNLDARLRVQMRTEIIELHRKMGVTTIYVTHDQIEAMTMGDRIVVMNKGVIQQVDTPEEVYSRPKNMFVANFIGSPPMNFIKGRLIPTAEGELEFHTNRFMLKPNARQCRILLERGMADKQVILGVRPEHVHFALDERFPANTQISGEMLFDEYVGYDRYYHLDIGLSEPLLVRSHANRRFAEKTRLTVAVDMDNALFYHKDSEMLLT